MPSAAPATPLLHDRDAKHAEALVWAHKGDRLPAVKWPEESDPDAVLPFADLMTMPSSAMTTAREVRSLMTFGGRPDVDVVLAPRLVVDATRYRIAKPSFAERFQELRERIRLPVQKYAVLLGTSRRTLYHWLETGRAQDQALWRLERLAEWVAEIEARLPPAEVQRLLDPELPDSIAATWITEGDEAAAERLRELIAATGQPRRARRLPGLAVDDTVGEPPTLGDEGLRIALSAFAEPRIPTPAPAVWTPPELTDTPAHDTV